MGERKKSAGELLMDYLVHCAARSDLSKTVYVVMQRVTVVDSEPAGTIVTWSSSRREAMDYAKQYPRLYQVVRLST